MTALENIRVALQTFEGHSFQIRGLEDALGVSLFVRKPRQLALTPQGRELQEVLGSAFDNISTTIERLKSVPEPRGVVSVR